MSYLGLDLDSLCREIGLLMKNNYGEEPTEINFNRLFLNAKKEILNSFREIIEENKEEVLNDFKEEWKEEGEEEDGN